jgi:hypothetical protein
VDEPVRDPVTDDPRRPGQVPEEPAPASPALAGLPCFDTDGDGVADTAVTSDGVDLVVLTDFDGDLFADQILRIGPDGTVRETPPRSAEVGEPLPDGAAGPESGS